MNLNYIQGPAYHGVTMLSLLLNNHTKISCLGDTIPPRAYDPTCACGELVSQCEFWQEIKRKLNTTRFSNSDLMLPRYPSFFQNQKLNSVFNRGLEKLILSFSLGPWIWKLTLAPWIWKLTGKAGDEYVKTYLDFYKAVCDIQGTSVFIDVKKALIKIIAQRSLLEKDVKIKVLHLVRDPRGFFNSCKKYKDNVTVEEVARDWVMLHRKIERLHRSPFDCDYFPLRYEDLCQEPANTMQQVFEFFGVENEEVCKPPANPEKHHSVGNRGTLSRFNGTIKLDYSWQERLSKDEQTKLIELTRPLSSKFGYADN